MRSRNFILLSLLFSIVGVAIGSIVQTTVENIDCRTTYYSDDRYIAYCDSARFGSYEHGALWFGLEHGTSKNIASAEVIVLGNSRTQFGFSTQAVREYFSDRHIPFYVLGFTSGEGSRFALSVLKRWNAKPKVLIINADPYFGNDISEVALDIMNLNPIAIWRLGSKYVFQRIQRYICAAVSYVCSEAKKDVFRSALDGTWYFKDSLFLDSGPFAEEPMIPITDKKDVILDVDQIEAAHRIGREFIKTIGLDPRCVIITGVPTSGIDAPKVAAALAKLLDAALVLPELSELATFDGSHLNQASARRWSENFMEIATPTLNACLGQ